jgi:mannose-1-phosphate guanylyltransferase/mannose-6-phosphate isomerase
MTHECFAFSGYTIVTMQPLTPLHDDRPWGSFDLFIQNEPASVKIITVAPNERLSLQRHAKRAEFWHAISGSGEAEIDRETHPLTPGTNAFIPIGSIHRLRAGAEGLQILEIALGHFDENDIERLEDDYGRTSCAP